MNSSDAKQAIKPPNKKSVEDGFSKVHEGLGYLEKTIVELASRLEPVLDPDDEQKAKRVRENVAEMCSSSCGVARELMAAADEIRQRASQLEELLVRLGI